MRIDNGDKPDVNVTNLDRTLESQDVSPAATAAEAAAKDSIPVDDRVALSLATNLLQQASQADSSARLARILELKDAIQKNQYRVDPMKVSRALIEAQLLGG